MGIGNRLRGDDGVGVVIAERLREDKRVDGQMVLVFEAGTVPENYLVPIIQEMPRQVILIDACDFGGAPGEFRLFSRDELAHLQLKGFSTHTLPLNMLAEMLGQETSSPVWLLGVQPAQTAPGAALSPPVSAAVPGIIDFLLSRLADL